MKTISKIIGVLALALVTLGVNAQVKIGHINSQELLAAMPETDSAQKKLEKIAKEHELVLEEMTVEFNKKYETYLKLVDDKVNPPSDLVRSAKEAELQEMQQRIQGFQQQAEQDIQRKRAEIFQPIQEKAISAVNKVAEENGYTYILDEGMGVIVYASPKAENILPLVKKKLGLE